MTEPIDQNVTQRKEMPHASLFGHDYLSMKPLVQWLGEVANTYARGVMLDYGCGNAPYRLLFQGVVSEYLTADVEQNKNGTVRLILGKDSSLPLQDSTMDTVLSTQVLEHVPSPERYLKEASRVLRARGVLILTCPASYMLHEEPHDYSRFTLYGLQALLRACGLHVVRIDTGGGAWSLMGQIYLNHLVYARKIRIPLISGGLTKIWTILVNVVFGVLDRVNKNSKDPLNYMIIAEKPSP